MKHLLWLCICLLVIGSSPAEARSRNLEVGREEETPLKFLPRLYQATAASQPNPPGNNFRVPTSDFRLPCQDSSPTCLTTLSHLAVQNSREIAVLEKAIQLQKKKLWTSWLSAEGLNLIAIGLRIARNVVGGGDRAVLKLEIARLELRRAELETNLRQALLQALLSYENLRQQVELAQTRLAAQHLRVALSEIGYRFGMGTTPEMLQEWERRDELHGASLTAERSAKQTLHQLEAIVYTSGPRP